MSLFTLMILLLLFVQVTGTAVGITNINPARIGCAVRDAQSEVLVIDITALSKMGRLGALWNALALMKMWGCGSSV